MPGRESGAFPVRFSIQEVYESQYDDPRLRPIAFLQRPAREKKRPAAIPRGATAARGLRGMRHGAQAASGPPVTGGRRVLIRPPACTGGRPI